MDNRDVQAALLPTPFVSSFVGAARAGDLYSTDPEMRSSAWARWAISSLAEFRGVSDRSYAAIVLPGKFYDPSGSGPSLRPHLEIPARVLEREDPQFPSRLAQFGNVLTFPWWLVSEVTAAKRSLFNVPKGDIQPLVSAIESRRQGLVRAVKELSETACAHWNTVERTLVSSPELLVAHATGDAEPEEVSQVFSAASEFDLRVVFDAQLRESNGHRAARRLGMWQLRGVTRAGAFGFGVGTPRLTPNSLFGDSQFAPEAESSAALLVRCIILRRLVGDVLEEPVPGDVPADQAAAPPSAHLRAIVARVGARLPEASVDSAVHFLQSYPDVDRAWEALEKWSSGGYLLTVSRDAFAQAHARALGCVRRADSPAREDINVILPVAWDRQSRVVRATFARPAGGDE